MNKYELPGLPYDYDALEPVISKKLLTLHHDVHHKGYVKGANSILEELEDEREDNDSPDMKALLKALSFNIGGHILHGLFWKNMAPKGEGGEPEGKLKEALEEEYGSIERFKEEFAEAAKSVEGSGWAALTYCKNTERPIIMQVEKHNDSVFPSFGILMVVDVWEHAYYLDYENKRGDFINAFWDIVNWNEVANRLEKIIA